VEEERAHTQSKKPTTSIGKGRGYMRGGKQGPEGKERCVSCAAAVRVVAFARLLTRRFEPEGGRNVSIPGRRWGGKARMDLISE
jgi:hypothetical protein